MPDYLKTVPASDDIINMLADAPNILEYTPSNEAKSRVWELVECEKSGTLTEEERRELDHYAQLEHILRLVKDQARRNSSA